MPNAHKATRKATVRNGVLTSGHDGAQPALITLNAAHWQEWQHWLAQHEPFVYYGQAGHFTAQPELRRGHAYWYGYRRRAGTLHKVYLGRAADLLPQRLEEANDALAGARPSSPDTNAGAGTEAGTETVTGEGAPAPPRLAWARLSPPALPPRLVERPRLTGRISTPLTLVYAPSGYGKSTLLNEWRRSCPTPVAWVTVTEAENQPLRFWMLLLTAIQRALEEQEGGHRPPDWQVASEDEIPQLLAAVTDDLAQWSGPAWTRRLSIILDDYHHIRNPKINLALQNWLEQWPPALHLVLAGHIKPPLAVGRLRARGLVTELDADDLRFTLEEGIQFLHQHQRQHDPLARREMETLVQRTKGWPAGLTLATMALAKQPDKDAFLDSFSGAHAYLSEYFVENVFARQSADVQEFLLKTAILRQLTGSLCDAVTGRTDSAALLAWLWQGNLFLMQLEQPDTYQYHTMFAEALQSELQRRMAALKPDLHRRAAEWYRRQHAIDDAVHHLLAIGAWEEAATLIEEIAVAELTEFGEDSRLLRWLRQLPTAIVQGHKTLLFLYVRLAHIGLAPSEMQRFLATVADRLEAKSTFERSREEEEVLAEIRRMRSQAPAGAPSAVDWRMAGGRHEAVWQRLGELGEAMHALSAGDPEGRAMSRRLYEAALRENNLFVALMAGSSCVAEAILDGQLRRGRRLGEELLQHAQARRRTLPEPASITLHYLAAIHLERNQLERCEEMLQRVREVDPNPTSTNMLISTAILGARLQGARGDGEAAQSTLQSARELHAHRPSGLWTDQDIAAYGAWLALHAGNPSLAQSLVEPDLTQSHALTGLVAAELLLAQAQPAAAATILQELLRRFPHHPPRESQIRTRLVMVVAHAAQQQLYEARRLLAAIVAAAAPEDFSRPFLDYAAPLAPLLHMLFEQGRLAAESRHFVRRLLALMGHHAADPALRAAEPEVAASTLTPRELEVLHQLAAGHTNAAIATHLTIAESTVKTHLANIYVKLRASNRVAAVAWLQSQTRAAAEPEAYQRIKENL